MYKTKIFAMYLPQFHRIQENDEFWGEGFTDWVTVKNAKPLFKNHQQPRIPLNNNYYDLSKKENVEWQSRLAYEYGVYGFGVYHYWFNNEKNLLTKPAEIMRDSITLKTKYFFIWDNCHWKRSWSNVPGNDWAPIADASLSQEKGSQVLIPYILGEESDWENHYRYVRTHFLSDNYEIKDNRPVFGIIWHSKEIVKMCNYWDMLAKKDGYDGMCFVFPYDKYRSYPPHSYFYNYEPHHTAWTPNILERIINRLRRYINISTNTPRDLTIYDYDRIWMQLIKHAKYCRNKRVFYGAFVGYDDSPRRGRNSSKMVLGGNPEKLKEYFKQLIDISKNQNKEYIFVTAWNEWGEGAYLEPDTKYGMENLDAIKEALSEENCI